MADERVESLAERAERRRQEQKQEEARREAAAAAARLKEVVAEWEKIVGQSILIEGSNGAPVEVIVKRVSQNGYVCMHVLGNTPQDNPGIWVALANVKMLDHLATRTPLGLDSGEEAKPAPAPQKRAPRKKSLTEAAPIE